LVCNGWKWNKKIYNYKKRRFRYIIWDFHIHFLYKFFFTNFIHFVKYAQFIIICRSKLINCFLIGDLFQLILFYFQIFKSTWKEEMSTTIKHGFSNDWSWLIGLFLLMDIFTLIRSPIHVFFDQSNWLRWFIWPIHIIKLNNPSQNGQ
jgi:hypothetical protein